MRRLIVCSLLLVAATPITGQNPPSLSGFGGENRIDVICRLKAELTCQPRA